jgi:hypothetical protein
MISKLLERLQHPGPLHSCNKTSSLSSTLTAENSRQKQLLVPASTAQKVSFNLDMNEHYTNAQLYKDEAFLSWYDHQAFQDFRRETAKILREITAKSNEAHNRMNPMSYDQVMIRAYTACCEANKEDAQVLTSFQTKTLMLMLCVNENWLGLEKWAVKPMKKHRAERLKALRVAVLSGQGPSEEDWEDVRDVSESFSLASRLFARTVALSLALSISSGSRNKEKRTFRRRRGPA